MQAKNTNFPVFSSRLSEAMKRKSLTQKALASLIKIHQTSISEYITGKSVPSAAALSSMADALGVTMDWLWGKSGTDGENTSCVIQSTSVREAQLQVKLDAAVKALEGVLHSLKQ